MAHRTLLERIAMVALPLFLADCHAQAHAKAQANGATDIEDDRKWETPESAVPPPTTSAPTASAAPAVPGAPAGDNAHLLGVVHDLSLAPAAQRAAACRCLAVDYGAPSDPKFAWQAGAPRVEPGMLAVAVAADGVPCSAHNYAPLRASISAVEREGDDIVVVMENVREGGPVMRGALIAAPNAGGSLVIRARRGAPYGAPLNGGTGPCRLPVH